MKTWYDKKEDILNIQLSDNYWKSIEAGETVIDIDKNGIISGIEIRNVSKVFSGDAEKVIKTATSN